MKRFLVSALCLVGCGGGGAPMLVSSQSFALFDPVANRIASESMDFTFTNVGGTTTPILQVAKTGDPSFLVVEDTCHVPLDREHSCHVSIALDGANAGEFEGQ